MALQTTIAKNALASAYATGAPYAALSTTVPSSTPGTEVSGGSYARQAISWSAPTNGVITGTVTFNVPASTTIAGAMVYSASTAGNYFDGVAVTSQAFATAGTYALTLTSTIS